MFVAYPNIASEDMRPDLKQFVLSLICVEVTLNKVQFAYLKALEVNPDIFTKMDLIPDVISSGLFWTVLQSVGKCHFGLNV